MMKLKTLTLTLLLVVPMATCDDEDVQIVLHEEQEADAPPEVPVAHAGPVARAMKAGPALHEAEDEAPGPVMSDAREAFDELSTLIEAKYVDGPLSEDELWTGAMEGVMARLVQLHGHRINTLMPPRAHQELLIGSEGRLVGVGVRIERVADVVVVRDVIAGGPAEGAGLEAGDRILGIDGERIKELSLAAVVDRIRGEEGSTVELFMQRDTEEWTQPVTRAQVEIDSVQSALPREGVGYVHISTFSRSTATELDEHLRRLEEQGAERLVLDLRGCPGGLLEASLEVAERFVPPGLTLMTIHPRQGEPDVRGGSHEHPWQRRPLSVLIGPKTASSAEIVADAIRTHGRGRLVGETTLGKHTIESIHELSGGWAVKLSVSRFAGASGERTQGTGVDPDLRIPMSGKPAPVRELDPRTDPVLSAALELLRDP